MDDLTPALHAARLERGWSQRELARRASVSQTAISNLERGAGSTLDTVTRVLDALRLTVQLQPIVPAVTPALKPCGTAGAMARHRARGETPCAACKAWDRDRHRLRRQVRAGSTSGAQGTVAA